MTIIVKMALILGDRMTIEGLLLAQEGAPIEVEREAYNGLSTEEGKTGEPVAADADASPALYPRPILAAAANTLIRTGGKIRVAALEALVETAANGRTLSEFL
jgi:hypothetical protein